LLVAKRGLFGDEYLNGRRQRQTRSLNLIALIRPMHKRPTALIWAHATFTYG